jgi:hypothetical protein
MGKVSAIDAPQASQESGSRLGAELIPTAVETIDPSIECGCRQRSGRDPNRWWRRRTARTRTRRARRGVAAGGAGCSRGVTRPAWRSARASRPEGLLSLFTGTSPGGWPWPGADWRSLAEPLHFGRAGTTRRASDACPAAVEKFRSPAQAANADPIALESRRSSPFAGQDEWNKRSRVV